MSTPHEIGPALADARDELFARPNVVATGIGYKVTQGRRTGELSIVCSVEAKVPRAQLATDELVPATVDGVPTDVIATGRLHALHDPTDRWRPAPGGVSVAHPEVSAGTLGCVVFRDGTPFILSNNHVLAASNRASIGDPILQPSPYDGGRDPHDRIALLEDFVELRMSEEESGCGVAQTAARWLTALARGAGSGARLKAVSQTVHTNRVDAAIARPLEPDMVDAHIAEIGEIAGTSSGELGMKVKKSGRTTGFTTGEIVQVEVTADIWYGERSVRFVDQLMTSGMSSGGDSGSAVLDEEDRLVGLLFGGSDDATLVNRIEHVFDALGVGV